MSFLDFLKKNIVMAFKTLFFKFGRYVCFFLLLFLIQSLVSTFVLIDQSQQSYQREFLEKQYTNDQGYVYHLRLMGLSDTQYAILRNDEQGQNEANYYYMISGGTRYNRYLSTGASYHVYDVDIQFVDGMESGGYAIFRNQVLSRFEDLGDYTLFETPLLSYELSKSIHTVLSWLLLAVIFGLSVFILWVLRSTLTAHDRFLYGIYISFGADFSALFMTALSEMLLLNVLLLIPSGLVGHLFAWLITRGSGVPFSFSLKVPVFSMAMTLFASLVAVFIDFRRTASTSPVNLLASSDNVEYIHSPKKSANILSSTFPTGIETLTLRRYRKYFVRILAYTLIFTALFSSASYFSTLYSELIHLPRPQYRMTFEPVYRAGEEDESGNSSFELIDDTTYNSTLSEILHRFPIIRAIDKSCVTTATDLNSHVLFDPSDLRRAAGGISVPIRLDGKVETLTGLSNVDYSVLDGEIAEYLRAQGYRIQGDLADVLSNGGTVAISDSFNNERMLKLKVGDQIRIAVRATPKNEDNGEAQVVWSNYDNYIQDNLELYNYDYRTYTVGAIISDLPGQARFPIYLNESDYSRLTGQPVRFTDVKIVLDPEATNAQIDDLTAELRKLEDAYPSITLLNLDSAIEREITVSRRFGEILTFLSTILMLTVPLVWILSQTLFYRRRKGEFDLYFAMGADIESIRRLFRQDTLVFAAVSGGTSLLLGTLSTCLVNRLVNNPYLYRLIAGENLAVRLQYRFPWLIVLVATLLMIGGAAAGVLIAEKSYIHSAPAVFTGIRKNRAKKMSKEASLDDSSAQTVGREGER